MDVRVVEARETALGGAAGAANALSAGAAWLAVTSFAVNGMFNAFITMDFAPVSNVTKEAMQIDDADVAWLYSVPFLATIPPMLFSAYLWTTRPYLAQLLSVLLTSGAGWIRVYAVSARSLPLCLFSGLFVGFGGSLILVAPAMLARAWLPPRFQALATGVMCQALYVGWALASAVVPAVVKSRRTMLGTMNWQGAACVGNVLLFLFCWPSSHLAHGRRALQPPTEGGGVLESPWRERPLPSMLCKTQFWVRSASFAALGGVSFAVPGVQDIVLCAAGYSQMQSASMNLCFICAGVTTGVLLGLKQRTPRQQTDLLRLLFVLAASSMTVTVALCRLVADGHMAHLKPALTAGLLVSNLVTGAATIGFTGFALEQMAEFPVPETLSSGAMEVLLQLTAAVLTQVGSGPSGFVVFAVLLIAAAALFCFGVRPIQSLAECGLRVRESSVQAL